MVMELNVDICVEAPPEHPICRAQHPIWFNPTQIACGDDHRSPAVRALAGGRFIAAL
jgi:hypothetical protein